MVKLIGHVFTGDPSKLKSVGSEGKEVRYPQRPTSSRVKNRSIYVNICKDHSSPQVVVPVELHQFEEGNKAGKIIGVAKVCPLCWTILKHP